MASQPAHQAAIDHPTNYLKSCQPDPMSDLGGVHLLHQYTSDILSDDQPTSQPTAIGQSISHLTNCQPNPKSDAGGEGQVDILLDGQSANWSASLLQLANANQPSDKLSI